MFLRAVIVGLLPSVVNIAASVYSLPVSDYFLPVFYVVLQLLIIIGIGVVVRRSGRWADNFFQGLSRLVVRVALPFYFIVRVSRTDLSQIRTMLLMPVSAVIVVGIGFVLSLILFAGLPFRGSDRRAGIAMATFGNSGYLPLAIAEIVPSRFLWSVSDSAWNFRLSLSPPISSSRVRSSGRSADTSSRKRMRVDQAFVSGICSLHPL